MTFEHEKAAGAFSEVEQDLMRRDFYPLSDRMIFVSSFLKESGASDEEIMLAYFNETLRLTLEERGQFNAYLLMCSLYWHVAKIVRHLSSGIQIGRLDKLPTDPPPVE
jgi:hypothetical protein